jgi:AraC-like DNA-binding protein
MSQAAVFATIDCAAEEIRRDASYCFDNARRSDSNRLIIQRTLRGAAFFENERRRWLVGAGWAMLFTHRERSRYGYPPTATEPYRQRFLAISPGSSVVVLFQRLRDDFGPVVRMPEESEARSLFDEIFRRYGARSFRDRFHESELVYRLFVALYREQVEGRRASDPTEFAFHVLHNSFRSDISLKTVAQRAGVTREHLIRTFSKRYRESPGAMLRRLRLEHACAMLTATEMPVGEVAAASGFTSANAFCRAFRRVQGTTPGAWRRKEASKPTAYS